MKIFKALALLHALIYLTGCISPYSMISEGRYQIGNLSLESDDRWNKAPSFETPALRSGSELWTHDGMLLDRLVVIPSIESGQTLLKAQSNEHSLPQFKSGMNPKEIEELAESTFLKYFGEGNVVIDTSNLKPHKFGSQMGVLFEADISSSEGPNYKGDIGAFEADEQLYLIAFFGATPYYYQRYRDSALSTILGAHVN